MIDVEILAYDTNNDSPLNNDMKYPPHYMEKIK